MTILSWVGILFCVSQSAMFSGLNLAFFSISKLRLEIESKKNNKNALKIAALRKNSNFLLTTILWGNVGINVLLTLLSNSVMAGVMAFLFSTFVITFFGEIIPQAYFSRHAMRAAALLSPVIRFYQILLYPVARPTSFILDKWLGAELMNYFQEKDLRELLKIHVDSPDTNIAKIEGKGALNFLAIDDLSILEEGEPLVPESAIAIDFVHHRPLFPEFRRSPEDEFLKKVHAVKKKWIILTDKSGAPKLALNSNAFLRSALFGKEPFDPLLFCHQPIIIFDSGANMGETIARLSVWPERPGDDVIDNDIILFWGDEKRIITGSDLLGRLLRGIVQHNTDGAPTHWADQKRSG